MTTASIGSTAKSQCKLPCQVGQYSKTGLEPCMLCEKNHYQPAIGQKSCIACTVGTHTNSQKATNQSACLPSCALGCFHVCDTGTCISEWRVCNGVRNCHDGSDQQQQRCSSCQILVSNENYKNKQILLQSSFIIRIRVEQLVRQTTNTMIHFKLLNISHTSASFNSTRLQDGVLFLSLSVAFCNIVRLHVKGEYLVSGYYNDNRLLLTDNSTVLVYHEDSLFTCGTNQQDSKSQEVAAHYSDWITRLLDDH